MKMLKEHEWKGNVRELENTLMQAIVLSKGDVIEKENILLRKSEMYKSDSGSVGSNISLEELEMQHIKLILDKCGWDIKLPAIF